MLKQNPSVLFIFDWMLKKILLFTAVVIMTLLITEVVMRFAGFKPYRQGQHVEIKPNEIFAFDSLLGYRGAPGVYKINNGGVLWTATQNAGGYRITNWDDTLAEADTLPAINIYGGAATYGYDLNDEATYPFVLQGMLPGYKVHNFGMSGYGVMANYLHLVKRCKVKKNDVVIYIYKADQDVRPSRSWQKVMALSLKEIGAKNFYFASIDTGLKPELHKFDYHLWPLDHYSALVNFTENYYNSVLDNRDHLHDISRKAFIAMNKWCKERGCKFILVGRLNDALTSQTLQYCADNGVQTVSLSKANIDIGKIAGSNINKPAKGDEDPAIMAHKIYANNLFNYLQQQGLVVVNR